MILFDEVGPLWCNLVYLPFSFTSELQSTLYETFLFKGVKQGIHDSISDFNLIVFMDLRYDFIPPKGLLLKHSKYEHIQKGLGETLSKPWRNCLFSLQDAHTQW